MTKAIGKIKDLGLKGCLLLFIALLLPPFTVHAESHTWDSGTAPSLNTGDDHTVTITGTISGTLSVPDGATVKITGKATTKTDITPGITLNIGNGATAQWDATLDGKPSFLVYLTGSGMFEVMNGSIINFVGTAIRSLETTIVKVSGGTVQGTNMAISTVGSRVEVCGGIVSAKSNDGKAISTMSGDIEVSGGTVQAMAANSRAISTTSGDIEISGGTIQATRVAIHSNTETRIIISGTDTEISIKESTGNAIHANMATIVVYDDVPVAGLENCNVTFSASGAGTASGAEISATYGGAAIQSGAKVVKNKRLVITANGLGGGEDDEYIYKWTGIDSTSNEALIESLTGDLAAACAVTGIDKTKPVVSSVAPSGSGANISGRVEIDFNEAMNAEKAGTVSLNGNELTGTWKENTYVVSYSDLDYDTFYAIAVSSFEDAAGNAMEDDSDHGFTTKEQPPSDTGSEHDEPASNPLPPPDEAPAPIPGFDDTPPNPSPAPDPAGSSTTMTNAGITVHGVRYVIQRQSDGTWLIVVPRGTDISKLAITFVLPRGATCVPANGSTQDFSGKTVIYKVTSANKAETEEYEIRVIEKTLDVTPAVIVSDTSGTGWSIVAARRAKGSYGVSVTTALASAFAPPDDIYVLLEGLLTNVTVALLDANGNPLKTYPDNDPILRALPTKDASFNLRITGTAASRKELESIVISGIYCIYESIPGSVFEQKISPALTYDKMKTTFADEEPRKDDESSRSGGCNAGPLEIAGLAGISLLPSPLRLGRRPRDARARAARADKNGKIRF